MDDTKALPDYCVEDLARLDPAALVVLMVYDEDRVPRSVIDACAARGEAMVEHLRGLADDPGSWAEDRSGGQWWLLLHAVMILGLIPGEQAGLLLVAFMRRMAEEEDDDLQDWLSGWWPALFANKPGSVVAALRALGEDRGLDWYVRTHAAGAVVAAASRKDGEALEQALAWVASLAADEQEDWDLRLSLGNLLLDFPREGHRSLLNDLAARQSGLGAWFHQKDVEQVYAGAEPKPPWHKWHDPWQFYGPDEIEKRQQRWAEEDARWEAREAEDDDVFEDTEFAAPYVREVPKIGRNDPCPCGSGRKYKKCCLEKDRG